MIDEETSTYEHRTYTYKNLYLKQQHRVAMLSPFAIVYNNVVFDLLQIYKRIMDVAVHLGVVSTNSFRNNVNKLSIQNLTQT